MIPDLLSNLLISLALIWLSLMTTLALATLHASR